MKNLEQFTTKEVVDYYIGYIMEHDLAASKSQARQLLLRFFVIVLPSVLYRIAVYYRHSDGIASNKTDNNLCTPVHKYSFEIKRPRNTRCGASNHF